MKDLKLNHQAGFTILEMLVATFMGLVILGLLLSSTLASKNLFQADVTRTKINQNLRSSLDIIGSQVRVAGENFSNAFPAITIDNNWNNSGSDRLVLRRNLLDEVIKSCVAISAGTYTAVEMVAADLSGCSYTDNTHIFSTWQNYRLSEDGDKVKAYIFNNGTRLGEFFIYDSDDDDPPDEAASFIGQYSINRAAGLWNNDYDEISTAVYIMEQWTFLLEEGNLQLIINDEDEPLNVATGINSFQVIAVLSDDTELEDFDDTEDWSDIKAIRVTLVGEDRYAGKVLERSYSADFFPRNVLSN